MPTPIPAKPSTEAARHPETTRARPARRAQALPILAALVAVGVATHLLGARPEPPKTEAPAASMAQRDTAEAQRDTADTPGAPELHGSPPREADPAVALRALVSALPHTERDAQKLKVLEVRALVSQGKIGAARGRAQGYFEQWPGGPDTVELEQLTGAHPRQ